MTDERIETVARRLADELIANRIARFETSDSEIRRRIVARVRGLLSGRFVEDSPD